MDSDSNNIAAVEDNILAVGDLLTEIIYEKNIDGQMNPNEVKEINTLLSEWIDKGRKLIEFAS